jgi:hypothetical protein
MIAISFNEMTTNYKVSFLSLLLITLMSSVVINSNAQRMGGVLMIEEGKVYFFPCKLTKKKKDIGSIKLGSYYLNSLQKGYRLDDISQDDFLKVEYVLTYLRNEECDSSYNSNCIYGLVYGVLNLKSEITRDKNTEVMIEKECFHLYRKFGGYDFDFTYNRRLVKVRLINLKKIT